MIMKQGTANLNEFPIIVENLEAHPKTDAP
jgi:hypothetical protein